VPLLNNELKLRSKKYLVQSRSFAEMLEATIHSRSLRSFAAELNLRLSVSSPPSFHFIVAGRG
jgi:hypothetical protein